MIITVTLNPAFDHILFLPELHLGGLSRAHDTIRMPGGKGVNVACSLAVLGEEVIATGFLGGQGGAAFERRLSDLGVTTSFVYASQETRTDFFIIEEKHNRQSLVVEEGKPVEPRHLNSFKSNFERLLLSAKLVEIGGSLPMGVPPHFIKELILIANGKKVRVVLNLPENILKECMYDTNPFLLDPDLRESKSMFGLDIYNAEARLKIVRKLLETGAEVILLNYGNLKYLTATKDELWEGEIDLEEKSILIGVRDAVLAGFIHKYLEKRELSAALKYGLGAGRSTASNKMNYPNSKKEAEEFALLAKVRRVE